MEQLESKLQLLNSVEAVSAPGKGWIHALRTSLNMSLRQLGRRLKISIQSAKEIEDREAAGTITINSLKEAGRALNMKFVYGFVPQSGSLEKIVEERALELAEEIVMRTSNTMKLEDQENTPDRIAKAIKIKAEEIKSKMPSYLWD